ncbi:MAG TPA: thioredoxin family protein [Mariprofundaceae bacterium]|nr:thioredoxin family protein [Mariprofundaceae bacterium]
MKQIKVLGTGCRSCQLLVDMIAETAKGKCISIELEKVEDIQEILRYGIMSTPGVVLDGEVVHSGGMPAKSTIESWLQ